MDSDEDYLSVFINNDQTILYRTTFEYALWVLKRCSTHGIASKAQSFNGMMSITSFLSMIELLATSFISESLLQLLIFQMKLLIFLGYLLVLTLLVIRFAREPTDPWVHYILLRDLFFHLFCASTGVWYYVQSPCSAGSFPLLTCLKTEFSFFRT